jgi:hypothetical protein
LNAQLLFHFIELVHGLTAGPKRQIEQVIHLTATNARSSNSHVSRVGSFMLLWNRSYITPL